jgi:hypothetical protein
MEINQPKTVINKDFYGEAPLATKGGEGPGVRAGGGEGIYKCK